MFSYIFIMLLNNKASHMMFLVSNGVTFATNIDHFFVSDVNIYNKLSFRSRKCISELENIHSAIYKMKIQITKGEISLLKTNIIKMMVDDDVQFHTDDMNEMNIAKLSFIGHDKHLLLFVSGRGSTISREALENTYNCEQKNCVAIAIVVNSLAQRFISNFFKQINKTKTLVKIFNTEVEAILWLDIVNLHN